MSNDLGDLGEVDFKRWCKLCGLIPTRPGRDQMGWDYLVEFKPEYDKKYSLDNQIGLRKVLIQIKSTRRQLDSISSKLSALKLLTDTDLPAFIVLISYSNNVVVRVKILHIGSRQIEKIQMKIRQIENSGRIDLHNFYMTLPLDEALSINIDGSDLKEGILKALPQNIEEYATSKSRYRRSCGYDEQSIQAHFTFAPGLSADSLVDLMIGKVLHLSVSEMVVEKARFGITLDNDVDRIRDGILSVEVDPFQKGTIFVTNLESEFYVEMSVDVFVPNIPNLPEKYRKIRFANNFLDIVFDYKNNIIEFEYKINRHERLSIDILANSLKFGEALNRPGALLGINFENTTTNMIPLPKCDENLSKWQISSQVADIIALAFFRHRRHFLFDLNLQDLEEIIAKNENMIALMTRPGLEMSGTINQENFPLLPVFGAIYCPACLEFSNFAYTAIVKIDILETKKLNQTEIWVKGASPSIFEDYLIDVNKLNIAFLNERAETIGSQESAKNSLTITTTISDFKNHKQEPIEAEIRSQC